LPSNDDPGHREDFELKGDLYVLKGGINDIKSEQAEQNKREDQYRREDIATKTRQVALSADLARLTKYLVILGLVGTVVSTWQSCVAKQAADAATSAAEIATNSLIETRKATAAAETAARATENQLIIQADQLAATRNAETQAREATALQRRGADQALASSRLDQRAFLYVSRFLLDREPDATNPNLRITLVMDNSGRTSARVTSEGTGMYVQATEPPRIILETENRSTVVHPNAPYNIILESERPLTAVELAAYTAKKIRIYVREMVRYKDIFEADHWVEVCAYRTFGMPLGEFLFCATGNDFDRNQPQ
jgi:hypothetical protein